tara:strand:+ start:1861 stop:3075 length:1215 start_codon:yes stop_codon:yes gene_type:complete
MKTMYGLPEKVIFCSKCVLSNQRPASIPEFLHKTSREGAKYLNLKKNAEGKYICDACSSSEIKEKTNWGKREKELLKLLDKHRSKTGEYDCVVPGSGGKDSIYASHILKYKYGMHPLTVTWPPILYTDYGYQNFKNWIEIGGFDNITFKQNGKVMKLLTKLSIQNLLHPFQSFILGQKNIGPKLAAKYKIPLIFYGESEAEYGNPISELSSQRNKSYWSQANIKKLYLAGVPIQELIEKHNLKMGDLKPFLPIEEKELKSNKIEVHYLGYYLKWVPQEAYYYSVEHTNFKARPYRTQGTYSKYNSLDDKIDDLHYYTTFIKFGLGRATYDSSQEIRNKHLTRDEAIKLVKRFDGEYPDKYLGEVLEYLEINVKDFNNLCDKFRPPHLWEKTGNDWKLKKPIYSL